MIARTEKFEDVIAWQKARGLTRAIYETTRQATFARDWGLTTQMQRATVSIMANIAEGFERRKPKEYLHFLSMAKASCAEVCSHLSVALDIGYLDQSTFAHLQSQANEVSRVIGGLRSAIERNLSRE